MLENISNSSNIFVDMDDTFIFTTKANNLAYIEALNYFGEKIDFPENTRITQEQLKHLGIKEHRLIHNYKNSIFFKYLFYTKINNNLSVLFNKISNPIFLVTRSEQQRALAVLKFHDCHKKFTKIFFCKNKISKYLFSINSLSISVRNIIVFDDDQKELEDARLQGICRDNLFLVDNTGVPKLW